jgi:hypothetical protein
MINLQTGTPLDLTLPHVYKYMDSKYMDEFFEEGKLRIGSFKYYRQFPDEVRGDKNEGSGTVQGKGEQGGFSFNVMTQQGTSSYMFCTSVLESDSLKEHFETDNVFRINNPLEFAVSISRVIPGVSHISLGLCNYRDHRLIAKTIKGLSINDFTDEKGHMIIGGPQMNKRTNQILGNGLDLMYLKEKKYQTQCEFRIVWTLNSNFFETNDHIDIICKEAIQFCEKIEKEK